MSFSGLISLIGSALKAVPVIAQELNAIRVSMDNARSEQLEREKQEILNRLNVMASRLGTTEDENEMASIIRNINRLGQ